MIADFPALLSHDTSPAGNVQDLDVVRQAKLKTKNVISYINKII